MKNYAKKKASKRKVAQKGTGGGPHRHHWIPRLRKFLKSSVISHHSSLVPSFYYCVTNKVNAFLSYFSNNVPVMRSTAFLTSPLTSPSKMTLRQYLKQRYL